jgi:ribonuclease BN (tRNA processing enzyme)
MAPRETGQSNEMHARPAVGATKDDEQRAHASLEDVAKMAAQAKVKTLVLSHTGVDNVD